MFSNGIDFTMQMFAPLAAALLATSIFTRKFIPLLKRMKTTQQIYELAPDSHQRKADTPTMGGVGIILGVLIGCSVAMAFMRFSINMVVTLVVFAAYGFVGFLDDYTKIARKRNLGLTAKQKIAFQLVVSLAVALYYVFLSGHSTEILIPFLWHRIDIGYWIIPYIVFIMVAMTNAVNLTDGLDGLAGGVTTVMSLFWPIMAVLGMNLGFRFVSAASSSETILHYTVDASFFVALAGACLGFLIYNRYPAQIFMGDTGSLAIGGGIASAAIFTRLELMLPVVGLIFVLEALSVIIQVTSYKLRGGKRVFKMAPLHHHFELSGWREQKVVTVFVAVTLVLCAVSVGMMFLQSVMLGEGASPPQSFSAP